MIEFDGDGYLKKASDWTAQTAITLAQQENIQLGEEHWFIINYLRDFYQRFPTLKTPALRLVINAMKQEWGTAKGNSLYFHQQLFPKGLIQACKIAGLPKSGRCKNNNF